MLANMGTSLDNNGNMGNSLEEIVLSWTASAVKDEKWMKEIPQTFCSVDEYIQCYKEHLVEETRSMILTSLNTIKTCQLYELLGISKEKNSSYFLDIDPFCKAGVTHAARNGDIYLLSNCGPDNLQVDSTGVFAMAIDISPHEYVCKSFHVTTKDDMTTRQFKYAFFLCNIKTNMRIWETLHHRIRNNAIIKQILEPPLDKQRCNTCTDQVKASGILDVLLNNELDRLQQDFAVRIASNVKCHHHQSLEVLLAPPRSGKTKIISTVLEGIKVLNRKILVCGPTVHSYSALSLYLLETMSGRAKIYNVLPAKRVGDAILLCDIEEELGLATRCSHVVEFCIGYRLRKLMPCMTWKAKVDGLISFLDRGFKEQAKKIEMKLKDKVRGKDIMMQSLRQMLERKSSTLVKLLKAIWVYAPSHLFSKDVEKSLADLLESLEDLNSAVQTESVTEEDVRQAFNLGKVESSKSPKLQTSIRRANSSRKHVNVNSNVVEMRWAKDECLKCLKCMVNHVTVGV